MKKLCALLLVLCLALSLALPAAAIGSARPTPNLYWLEDSYAYTYIDYNRDGTPELVAYGGESEQWPSEFKIYTYVNGEVKQFEGAGLLFAFPERGRNWLTRQSKWLILMQGRGQFWVHEVIFDFENFTIKFVGKDLAAWTIPFYFITLGILDIQQWVWEFFWKFDPTPVWYEAEGTLTPEIIEELLLNPPA